MTTATPSIPMTQPEQVTLGLSEQEAVARRQRGEGNDARLATSRPYREILQQNVFNFINIILFAIGAVMIALGRFGDAFVSVGLILLNVVIGTAQEVRAKRQLDRIALLTRPKVSLIREGQEKVVDPAEIVRGDILVARPGDQIVVDGVVVGAGRMEVDESLLTGESDLIPKRAGDAVLSGSFCVTGSALYEAQQVGAQSYANRLTTEARSFRVVKTPLQRDVEFVIRLLTLVALFIGALLLASAVLYAVPLVRSVQMAAVIAGLIPNGLFFMVIVAYALGALRIVRCGALVQQANSVESLSNVNVLCMDKTGTLTANRIHLHDIHPLGGVDREALGRLLGNFAASVSVSNRTGEALAQALPGRACPVADEVPFSSARKWSAIACDEGELRGAYVLGAPEMLQPHLRAEGGDFSGPLREWSEAGLRVLLFARNAEATRLHDEAGQPCLPPLTPLGVVAFSDELRPALRETLSEFARAGVRLKIISGDNPHTVASLARQAGFNGDLKAISGPELAQMDLSQLEQAAEEATVFGRITPQQKELLVEALRRRGYYVAMIGDGVNDVLSLKKSHLGIAMQSGSAAARGVADMVLLDDSFGALPPAFLEGQRIINGMQDILRLFLTRALYVALLILSTAVMGIGFPYVPKHVSLLTFFTVGIPTLALAVWARPGNTPRRGLLRAVTHFVFPAAITTFIFGLGVYTVAFGVTYSNLEASLFEVSQEDIERYQAQAGVDYPIDTPEAYRFEVAGLAAQTSLTTFTLLAGLALIVFVEPPSPFFVGGDIYSGDRRPTLLAMGLLLAFAVVLAVEPLRRFFELMILPAHAYAAIAASVVVWALLLRQAWRGRWLERFLQLDGR